MREESLLMFSMIVHNVQSWNILNELIFYQVKQQKRNASLRTFLTNEKTVEFKFPLNTKKETQ